MSLYHRTYTRIPLALDVRVQFKGEKLGHTFTRNVDPFGAFIELPKPEIATNDFVEMLFNDKDNDHASVLQKGMVMHRSNEGVGILFAYDTDEFRAMLVQEMTDHNTSEMLSD